MWIPTRIYEALPAAYVTVGLTFLIGALYVGVSHQLWLVYMVTGIVCVFGGVVITGIRHNARSQAKPSAT